MSGLNLDKIQYDGALDFPNVLSITADAAGNKITSTLVSGKQGLDVNVVNASIAVTQSTSPWVIGDGGGSITVDAVDLDIRDLSHTQDSVKIGDGVDFLAINADGSINANLTDDGIADDAADSGNPFKVGGKAYSGSALRADPVDNGDRANLSQDLYRRLRVSEAMDANSFTAITVTTTATQFVSSALSGRREITIQNRSSNSMYLGNDNTVTTSTGLEIPKGASATFELSDNVQIWLIAGSGSNSGMIMEAA